MSIRRSGRLVVVPVLLLATACGQQRGAAGAGDSDLPAVSRPAEAVMFRMEAVGGFVTPAVAVTRLPAISVYGDGRVIIDGPVPLLYPGPALPNLRLGTISAAEVDNLITLARAGGVGDDADLGTPSVADATSTRFTVFGVNGSEQLEVYAFAEAGGSEPGLTADQRAARDRLRKFVASLTSASGPLAAVQGSASQPYVPTAVAGVAEPWVGDGELGGQREVPWPGPELPGGELGADLGLGCVTVTGGAARTLLTVAAEANSATPWTSGGRRWTVTLRPLLPDETNCADLTTNR
ncbi:hypothetical protein QTQ03_06705 [Micromonospora sp. WMMA1363]|uniref:hypothetical protein n=1 Tax=Micromonospora sp. WMMA1363 TaxID=3053985 RepID=UPI00259CC927|nr:hypothetical protein [Micromonospora sp. WMMA1363]MDM4719301.1 hypothetical protein [Micromonospora sp. WMMA1363]